MHSNAAILPFPPISFSILGENRYLVSFFFFYFYYLFSYFILFIYFFFWLFHPRKTKHNFNDWLFRCSPVNKISGEAEGHSRNFPHFNHQQSMDSMRWQGRGGWCQSSNRPVSYYYLIDFSGGPLKKSAPRGAKGVSINHRRPAPSSSVTGQRAKINQQRFSEAKLFKK